MNKPTHLLIVLTLLMAMAWTANAAEEQKESLHVLELKHRPANEIIPIIQPLLKGKGSVIGSEQQLFIRSSDATFAEIKSIISQIDSEKAKPRQFIITVIQGEHEAIKRQMFHYNPYGQRYKVRSTNRKDTQDHQVQVMEGHSAYIRLGQTVPQVGQAYSNWPYGQGYHGVSVEYRDIYSGMTVVPKMVGQQVQLMIKAQKQQLNSMGEHNVNTKEVASTVIAELGQWSQLGGTLEHGTISSSQNYVRRSTKQKRSNYVVFIRADLVQ